MLHNIDLTQVLFLDIETVSQYRNFEDLPARLQPLWERKASFLKQEEEDTPETLYQRAGIYAEFGKVVCISCGFLLPKSSGDELRVTSYYGKDEKEVLQNFANMLNAHFSSPDSLLCGHNAKEFDFPYLCRRMVVNGIEIPPVLNLAGKKPWEVQHLDTMQLWKFGDFKSFTSLDLLAAILDIPTPKDDISGADVSHVFWENDDLERIKNYCQKDVVCLVNVLRKYLRLPLVKEENIAIS